MSFVCTTCGQAHDGLPDVAFRWPDPYFDVPEAERASRIKGAPDTCSIDDRDFFIRGIILIPIREQVETFGLGVWVSQKLENFLTYIDNQESSEIGPFFGWLSNTIAFYEADTWAMQTKAHFQGGKMRPLIELAPCDHPLYRDYSEGITLDRAWAIVHLHEGSGST